MNWALFCTIAPTALDFFPYFWPLSENELRAFEARITIRWALDILETEADLRGLRQALQPSALPQPPGEQMVVLFTMNEYTGTWASAVGAACRGGGVDEMVGCKDPTVRP